MRLRGIAVGDATDAWQRAGFTVADAVVATGGVTIGLRGDADGRGVLGWALDPGVADVDGIAGVEVTPRPDTPHPNGVAAVDHVVVATPDLERTTQALGEHGLAPRRTIEAARGDVGTVYRFFLLPPTLLEVIAPSDAAAGPARLVGIAFVAADLTALGDGWSRPRPAVQPGRRIATLDGRRFGVSVPVAALSPRQDDERAASASMPSRISSRPTSKESPKS